MTAPNNGFSVIGKPLTKPDAVSKVTGRAIYADDMLPPRTLTRASSRSTRRQRDAWPVCWR